MEGYLAVAEQYRPGEQGTSGALLMRPAIHSLVMIPMTRLTLPKALLTRVQRVIEITATGGHGVKMIGLSAQRHSARRRLCYNLLRHGNDDGVQA